MRLSSLGVIWVLGGASWFAFACSDSTVQPYTGNQGLGGASTMDGSTSAIATSGSASTAGPATTVATTESSSTVTTSAGTTSSSAGGATSGAETTVDSAATSGTTTGIAAAGGSSGTGAGGSATSSTTGVVSGPDPDNPANCPMTQPAETEACMLIATCNYIADVVTNTCQCVAGAWQCTETLAEGVCPAMRPADDSECNPGGETLSCEYGEETCNCQTFNTTWNCNTFGNFQGGFQGGVGTTG